MSGSRSLGRHKDVSREFFLVRREPFLQSGHLTAARESRKRCARAGAGGQYVPSSGDQLPGGESAMDLELTGKKALVTGSTAGIGLAIASLLAREGASVVVNGRSQARVQEAAARVRKEAPDARVTGVAADLGTREGADRLTGAVPEVDVLVNNLGIYKAKP